MHAPQRTFTPRQLRRYDGKHGRAAYVACNGIVYDGSRSYHWQTGIHWVQHRAGCDLTAEMTHAPHGSDLLERFPRVGVLIPKTHRTDTARRSNTSD